MICLCSQAGEEKVKIERPQANIAPVWAVSWNPNRYSYSIDFSAVITDIEK